MKNNMIVKRTVAGLMIAVLAAVFALASYADVIYEPDGNVFYEKHREDMIYTSREFEMNGPDGEAVVYDKPNGKETDRIENGNRLYVSYIYSPGSGSEWGLVEYTENTDPSDGKGVVNSYYRGEKTGWIPMEMLSLVYDAKSFSKDHEDEFIYENTPTIAPVNSDIVGWKYPGSDTVVYEKVNSFNMDEELTFDCWWKDKNGDQWGHISYLYGMRDFWVYLPDPFRTEPIDTGLPVKDTVDDYNSGIGSGTDQTDKDNAKPDNKLVPVCCAAGAVVIVSGVLIAVIFGKKKKS